MREIAQRCGHVREHGSVLAGMEKRALVWIAQRLPDRVNADHLSGLGLLAMVGSGVAFWMSNWYELALIGVLICLVVNWFGDSLDGTVARVRRQQRPNYGFYVDHVLDIIGAFFLFVGLGLSPFMSLTVALLVLVAFLLISAEVYLATHARGTFNVSIFRVGPTELRILLASGVVYLFYKPTVVVFDTRHLLFDVGGSIAVVGMFVALLYSICRNTIALYRAEPMPVRAEPFQARASVGHSSRSERRVPSA